MRGDASRRTGEGRAHWQIACLQIATLYPRGFNQPTNLPTIHHSLAIYCRLPPTVNCRQSAHLPIHGQPQAPETSPRSALPSPAHLLSYLTPLNSSAWRWRGSPPTARSGIGNGEVASPTTARWPRQTLGTGRCVSHGIVRYASADIILRHRVGGLDFTHGMPSQFLRWSTHTNSTEHRCVGQVGVAYVTRRCPIVYLGQRVWCTDSRPLLDTTYDATDDRQIHTTPRHTIRCSATPWLPPALPRNAMQCKAMRCHAVQYSVVQCGHEER